MRAIAGFNIRFALLVLLLGLLAHSAYAATRNSAPIANAGLDQVVHVGDTVTLNGSASIDPDGDPLTFQWDIASRPRGSTATLSDPTAVNPTFFVDLPGTYKVKLVVNDGAKKSRSDTVQISTQNSPPVANAGPDQTVFLGATVQLDGSRSSDPDGNMLTYSWAFVTLPTGSTAVLQNPTTVNPTFVVDVPGTYVVELVVSDGLLTSAPDTVQISTQNSPPVANAGSDQTVITGALVQLNGGGSSDVDGNPLTFQWAVTTRPTGSSATLSDPTLVNPTFVADVFGTYVVQLIVNDGTVNSAPDTVQISTQNSPPVANAGPDQTVFVGNTVTLDGSGSSDVDGNPLTFQWAVTTRPTGSNATLSDPTLVNPTFVADVFGTYVVQLIVNDGTVDSAPDTVQISTQNSPPVANAGPDQNVMVGATVQLDGTGSTDADGNPLSCRWSFTSIPAGSNTTLANPSNCVTSFIADLAGTFVVQLIVNDGNVDSGPDTAMITVAALPTVTIEATDPNALEAGLDTGTFTITRTGDTVSPLAVLYTIGGTATNGTDYQSIPATVTIPAAQASATVTITPIDDTAIEGPETVILTLAADPAYTIGAQNTATVTITDNDFPEVTIAATDANAAEQGLDPGTFTVTRTGPTTSALTVNYTISGTATNGTDYQTIAANVSIPVGQASATVTVTPVDDALIEGPETVVLTLSADPSYTLGAQNTATVTITDNDFPEVTIAATDANAAEQALDPGTFTVSRTGPTTSALTVNYTIGGSATNGTDYQNILTSVTISAGQASATVTVTPVDDALIEGPETVILTLAADPAYTLGAQNTATVTIADNDFPVVTIAATDASAAEQGLDPGTFTVSRTGPTTSALTVNYTIAGTATNGTDYTNLGTTVTIPAGQPSAALTVTPVDDAAFEGPETVILTLAADPAYTIGGQNTATVTIADNDLPVVTIAATDANAAEAGLDPGTFTIARTGPTTSALTVNYTIGGAATNGTDYQNIGTSVTIPVGQASASVTITPIDDTAIEGPETVILSLSADPAYTLATQTTATVTITDNDFPVVTIAATDANAAEAALDPGTFTVSRTGPTTNALTVNYTIGGTATNGTDYQTIPTTVTIPAGQASAAVTITPIDDSAIEGPETVILTLAADPAYTIGAQITGTVTIADNDLPVVTIAATDANAAEQALDSGTFTVTRTGPTTSALTVSYTVGGTATNGTDYANIGTSVTIPVGQASATVTITPIDDILTEGAETVILTLAANAAYTVGTPNSATVTIADDDLPTVTVTATNPNASEAGPVPGVFTFTRTGGNLSLQLQVSFTRGGTATDNVDYTNIGTTVNIPANQSSATVTITPLADNLVEGDETVVLTLNASSAYLVGTPNPATVTIADDPPVVTIAASDASASEAGLDPGSFTFTRTGGNLSLQLQVSFTRGGTATNGADYTNIGTTVNIPANQSSATVTITPLADNLVEGDETVVLTITVTGTPPPYIVGTPSTDTVTIADND